MINLVKFDNGKWGIRKKGFLFGCKYLATYVQGIQIWVDQESECFESHAMVREEVARKKFEDLNKKREFISCEVVE